MQPTVLSSPPATRIPLQPVQLNQQHQTNVNAVPIKSSSIAPTLPVMAPSIAHQPEEHISKWQRLDNDPSTAAAVKKQVTDVPVPAVFDYHSAIRAAGIKMQQDDGRVSLIPDVPGTEIDPSTAPTPKTAKEMLNDPTPCLSLGDSWLDAPLQGGLGEGITEIVGEAACGKTQLAMQLLLQCQLPKSEGGLNGGALFLAMEGDFPINRLRSLADSFKRRHPKMTQDMLNKIFIKPVNTPIELWNVLCNSLRPTLESGDVKLIVLDSIAAMFRTEHDAKVKEQDFSERSQELLRLAQLLKQYSSTYHIPIVVINQVADFFAGSDHNSGVELRMEEVKHSSAEMTSEFLPRPKVDAHEIFLDRLFDVYCGRYLYHWSQMSSGRRVLPALGLTWANCVNTRIFLTRKHEFMAAPSLLNQPALAPSIDTHGVRPLVNMFTVPGSSSANSASYMHASIARAPLTQQQSMMDEVTPPATHVRRFLHITFSPTLPPGSAEFIIETSGIRGTSSLPDSLLTLSPPSPQMNVNTRFDVAPTSMPYSHRSYAPILPSFHSMQQQHQRQQPIVTTSFTKNMFTPSGGGRSSYFDDDEMTSAQEELEAEALARAEAEVEKKRAMARTNAPNLPPILDPMQVAFSPKVAVQPQAQTTDGALSHIHASPPPQPNMWQHIRRSPQPSAQSQTQQQTPATAQPQQIQVSVQTVQVSQLQPHQPQTQLQPQHQSPSASPPLPYLPPSSFRS